MTACACTGIDLVSPVGNAVEAVTISTATPITIETALAVPLSKEKRNGAAISSAPARYSMMPWAKAGSGPCLYIAKTLAEEDFGRLEQAGIEQLGGGEGLVERDELDRGAAQGDHHAEAPGADRIDRGDAEARAEHAVVGERRAAAR